VGIHPEHAHAAGGPHWSCPCCPNAHTTAVDIPYRSNVVLQNASLSLIVNRKKRRNYEITQSFTIHGSCYVFCIGC
jgi:hypothetical protein